ncbi:MAG: hypothetical protein Q9209_006378 [Squamulea sp. 1 TL-2023]
MKGPPVKRRKVSLATSPFPHPARPSSLTAVPVVASHEEARSSNSNKSMCLIQIEIKGHCLEFAGSASLRVSSAREGNLSEQNDAGFGDSNVPATSGTSQANSTPRGTSSGLLLMTPTRCMLGPSEDGEPTLPLTPVQLGLEPPPDPPSGLFLRNLLTKSTERSKSAPKSSPSKPQRIAPSGPSDSISKGASSTQ